MTNSVFDTTSMKGTQVPMQPTVTTKHTCLPSSRSSAVLLPEILQHAAVECSEDTREVLLAPEIEFNSSDDEPVLELTRDY